MGIIRSSLKIIIHEHLHKPIEGKLLVIGKQTVGIKKREVIQIFNDYNLDTFYLKKVKKFDNSTRAAKSNKENLFFDHDVFKAISPRITYHSLDKSKYENADIIQDMNLKLDKKLYNKFDFIIDGGSMDNSFDPVSFLKNITRMLKTNGRAVLINHFYQTPGAFLAFSPEYYYSYFAINNFADVKVYVAVAKSNLKDRYNYRSELYSYCPYFKRVKNFDYFKSVKKMNTISNVITVVEKKKNSTHDKIPVQIQYMEKKDIDWKKKYFNYKKIRKNYIKNRSNKKNKIFNSDHFKLIDEKF